jgi:hypothetical protein
MTEKNLAAHRTNAQHSRGAVTPAGKARRARANLRHGFYAEMSPEILDALGEDAAEYARLAMAIHDQLQPQGGFETELAKRMVRIFWRMRRIERIQDGLALQRIRNQTDYERLRIGPGFSDKYKALEQLSAFCRALERPDYVPSAAEIAALGKNLGSTPAEEKQQILHLATGLAKLAGPNSTAGPGQAPEVGPERGAAVEHLLELLSSPLVNLNQTLSHYQGEMDEIGSAANRAAMMAPDGEKAEHLQRMEDASLRQLWRLTNLWMKVRNGEMHPKNKKVTIDPDELQKTKGVTKRKSIDPDES